MKKCPHPGCRQLITNHVKFCDAHTETRQQKRNKQSTTMNREFYNSTSWRELSKRHRTEYPLCRHCLELGILTPVSVVDHIIEIDDDPTLKLDPQNLQSLCHPCHNSKTASERRTRELNTISTGQLSTYIRNIRRS